MYDDVLLPTDGTSAMDRVVDRAAGLARDGGTVHLLYVVDDRAFLTLADADSAADRLRAEGEAALARAEGTLAEADARIRVRTAIRRGDPATAIVDYAESAGVDAVVMGARAEYERNMLGSVSQGVLARSPVPVLTVRLSGATADDRRERPPADD